MPIDLDIRDHEFLVRQFAQGEAKGRRELFGRQLEKRFGPLPQWAKRRFDETPDSEIMDLAMKLVDAKRLNEIFS